MSEVKINEEKRKESIKPSIIAVLVLVIIALVSGALLAILNDVLFVSAEERTARALAKVYKSESYENLTESINGGFKEREVTYYYFKTNAMSTDTTTVTGLYRAADGTVIIGASGVQGWNGKAEIMMAVGNDGEIKAVVVSTLNGDDKATSVNQKYLNNAYVGKNVFDNPNFTMRPSADNDVDISAGATARTSQESVASAVSMGVWYLNNVDILGGAA